MRADETENKARDAIAGHVRPSANRFDDIDDVDLLGAIEHAVRATLRISLRPGDGSQRNQDGLELVNDAWLKLLRRLRERAPVRNPKAYAYLTAKNLCLDYFRRLSRRHRSLQDSALRYLRLTAEFAAWKIDGRWVTGVAAWRRDGRLPAGSDAVQRVVEVKQAVLDANVARLPWEAYRRREWHHVMSRIFELAHAPLWLNDLMAIMFAVANIPELKQGDLMPDRSAEPSAEASVRAREELRAVWIEINALSRRQRLCLLLNSIDGELDRLPNGGVATLQEIAAALDITAGEFAALQEVLPSFAADVHRERLLTTEEYFAVLWRHVPIDDSAIAHMLGIGRQEVANGRIAARQRLHRRLSRRFGGRRRVG